MKVKIDELNKVIDDSKQNNNDINNNLKND